jgi:hypothetical protein
VEAMGFFITPELSLGRVAPEREKIRQAPVARANENERSNVVSPLKCEMKGSLAH